MGTRGNCRISYRRTKRRRIPLDANKKTFEDELDRRARIESAKDQAFAYLEYVRKSNKLIWQAHPEGDTKPWLDG